MQEVQALVLVAFITAAAIVVVCVLQAKSVLDVSCNVKTQDQLQLSVDRRADLVGATLTAAGVSPDDNLSERLSDPAVARALDAVGALPVIRRGSDEDAGHMLVVDSTSGLCCANAPSRRMTAADLRATPVNMNDLYAAPYKQAVIAHEAGTQGNKRAVMPRVRAKVASGGGHVTFTAVGGKGKRRWHTYFCAIPHVKGYLGASAPVGS